MTLLDQIPPPSLSREARVHLLVLAATALRTGQAVPADSASYLGGALAKWLSEGGDLDQDGYQGQQSAFQVT